MFVRLVRLSAWEFLGRTALTGHCSVVAVVLALAAVALGSSPAAEPQLTKVCVDSAEVTSAHKFILEHGGGWFDRPCRLLEQPPSSAPDSLMAALGDTTVLVKVLVDSSGRVIVASLIRGTSALAEPALDVACGSVFEPARCRGIPVHMEVVVPIRFVP